MCAPSGVSGSSFAGFRYRFIRARTNGFAAPTISNVRKNCHPCQFLLSSLPFAKLAFFTSGATSMSRFYKTMQNPFPNIIAKQYAKELIQKLDTEKCLDFEQDVENRTPLFSTKGLFEKHGGIMFGLLVCKEKASKEDKTIVLKAFSGQFEGFWNIDGWCPPLLDVEKYNSLVKQADAEIQELTKEINTLSTTDNNYKELFDKRSNLSKKAFMQIQDLYHFSCIDKTIKTLLDLKATHIPTGTGDCCAPKLLNEAFKRNLIPLSLAEFYYGEPNASNTKKHKTFYEPCDEKCSLILPTMLGLHIIYKDEHIVVIHKEQALLSVPGRGEENQDCVVSRLKKLYPEIIEQPSVHRLDLDTSGIMVFALTKEAHKNLSMQFEKGTVVKKYLAVLDGNIHENNIEKEGIIELPFRLDIENRPFQVYDEIHGKMGKTKYKIVDVKKNKTFETNSKYVSYVEFTPITGRTHQLRLHASHKKGLGIPIVGDRLYGNDKEHFDDINYGKGKKRLMLQAFYLEFDHPVTNERMSFEEQWEF